MKSGDPWRIRQTGVYQVHDSKSGKLIFIIISPSPTAQFVSKLREVLRQSEARSALLANPMLIHTMLISCHLFSWREYLESQDILLLKRVRLEITSTITRTLIYSQEMKSIGTVLEVPLVSFDTLKEVRAIEKRMLVIEHIITSFHIHLDDLKKAYKEFENANKKDKESHSIFQAAIEQFKSDSISYKDQAVNILKRTQTTAQSVSDILNLSYQQLARSQSENTFTMATSAREDSIAIRSITFVTSFYLPFSFVAVS